MDVLHPKWTIGIEEEYMMIDCKTGELSTTYTDKILKACREELKELVHPEFLQAQIEVSTNICVTIKEAREQLQWLRRTISTIASEYDVAPIASSTHPMAEWVHQKHTDAERYHIFAHDMQAVVRRLVISGMHIHVGIDNDELRIDLMNQISYFLPHLLALSTSSPLWRGQDTGLRC